MNWYIQNSGIRFDGLERNVDPLVPVLADLKLPMFGIGFHSETQSITGLEDADRSVPSFFYGSTRVAELAKGYGFRPGAFYEPEWFDPRNWVGKRNDLLNPQQSHLTVGALRRNWILGPSFVKSIEGKVLTGMVLEGPDSAWWLKEYAHLKDEDELVISPVAEITQEWRFFIVDRRVIAGSQYKHDGVKRIRGPIPEWAWTRAHWMAEDWLPADNIVMDICRLGNGDFKVVEFNSLSSSGWYNADVRKVVLALEWLAKNKSF